MTLSPAFTVEIHDVSPLSLDACIALHAELRHVGVLRPTLLVIPCFEDEQGRRWDLRQDQRTRAWLLARQADQCEIIQHGLTHRAPDKPPPGLGQAFMHYYFSRGCAEFAHLAADQARRRLERGQKILARCGLTTRGFIAPAWQQSRPAIAVTRAMGYEFTAFFNHLLHLTSLRSWPSPALTFAAFHPGVDYAKRIVMRCWEASAQAVPLLRVALHPDDLQRSGLIQHVLGRISALQRKRSLVSYQSWFASWDNHDHLHQPFVHARTSSRHMDDDGTNEALRRIQ